MLDRVLKADELSLTRVISGTEYHYTLHVQHKHIFYVTPFVLRTLPHWRRALRSSVVDGLIALVAPVEVNLVLMTST